VPARIIPVLYAEDVRSYIDFLQRAFGFEMSEDWTDPGDSEHVNVELRFGDSVVSICRANAKDGHPSAREFTGEPFGFYVEVDDVDAHLGRAREVGTMITSELETQPWGKRMYSARDPEGYAWSFASV
jgi:uncharacterized glyoxalase superfamily protein PhnB